MTTSFVLTNHKGGVGKSTSSTNIALGLVQVLRQAKAPISRVLLIDTDSQAHASLLTTQRNDFGRDNSLYTVVVAERKDAAAAMSRCIVESTWDEDLHVLPGSALLESAERELTGVPGAPYRIQNPLSKIASHYAAIVIDTRPSFSLLTEMGLLAATHAIVPVEPRFLETVGLSSVVNKIADIREGWRHPDLHVSGILVTKLDGRMKGHVRMLESLQAHAVLGKMLCGVIPANEAVAYSHHHQLSIFDYDPSCSASKAYADLVGKLAKQVLAAQGGV